MITTETRKCEICGSNEYFTRYNMGKHRILRCRECTFMWLFPVPTFDELKEVYGEHYFHNQEFFQGPNECIYGYFDYLGERFDRQNKYRHISRDIVAHLARFESGRSRLLDVGCGYGFFLDAAQDVGLNVRGIEFNGEVVKEAKRKYSFPIIEGDLMNIRESGYDVITMFDILEHLACPVEAVKKCREMLDDDGLLVITTMDSDSLVSRLFGTRLEDFRRVREHLSFPTRKSMRRLLKENGFDIIRISSYGHTFRLRFLAQRIELVNRPLGRLIRGTIDMFGLGDQAIDLNPRTKMMIMARRR